MIVYRPLKAIRLTCLDCSQSRKDVTECPCNGVASPLCKHGTPAPSALGGISRSLFPSSGWYHPADSAAVV
jgi:hypothetical protein